jgi:hypothetical protein
MLINAAIFLVSVAFGYFGRGSDRSPRISFVVGLVFGILAVLLSLRYAASRSQVFRLPSLARAMPWYWWDDPLQFYLIWDLFIVGCALGSGALLFWGGFFGVVIAQAIGFFTYRERIKA